MNKIRRMNSSIMVLLASVVCCLNFVFIQLVSCEQQKPVISYISNEKIKEIGEEVEFNCTVQNNQDYPILWIKLDKDRLDRAPLSSDTALIIRDKRFSVKVDNKTNTYSLKIKELQETDTGFYQCQVLITVSDKVTAEVELQIRRPPVISPNTTHLVNVTEGKPIELHCNADGFPVPRISWKRENDVLLSSGGAIYRGDKLKIASAHRDDRGVYYCIAENGVGAQARANATVRVSFSPVITAIRPRVGQARGYDASLECRIEAHPQPIVSWFKNGEEIKREQSRANEDEFVETLQRLSIGSRDYGEYVCRAKNEFGVAETKVELFETVIPVCVNSCG